MSSPISTQLDLLGKCLASLDASVAADGQIGSSEFLDAVDSLLALFGMYPASLLQTHSCQPFEQFD